MVYRWHHRRLKIREISFQEFPTCFCRSSSASASCLAILCAAICSCRSCSCSLIDSASLTCWVSISWNEQKYYHFTNIQTILPFVTSNRKKHLSCYMQFCFKGKKKVRVYWIINFSRYSNKINVFCEHEKPPLIPFYYL